MKPTLMIAAVLAIGLADFAHADAPTPILPAPAPDIIAARVAAFGLSGAVFNGMRPVVDAGADVKPLARGAKANHLTYLGDVVVGERTNVGAGTITCNYDGFDKHQTTIGAGVFVGSDVQLVAPVTVGDGAVIGAGTTLTKDVPVDGLATSRSPQTIVPGGGAAYLRRRKAAKESKKKEG